MGVFKLLLPHQMLQFAAMRMIDHIPDQLVKSDLLGLATEVTDLFASHGSGLV